MRALWGGVGGQNECNVLRHARKKKKKKPKRTELESHQSHENAVFLTDPAPAVPPPLFRLLRRRPRPRLRRRRWRR